MKEFKLPLKTFFLWEIRLGLLVILLSLLLFWVLKSYLVFYVSAAVLVLLLIYIPLFFKSTKIKLSAEVLIIERGFLIKTAHILPRPRIIYASAVSLPLSRRLSLSAIEIKGTKARIFLPELNIKDVEEILKLFR